MITNFKLTGLIRRSAVALLVVLLSVNFSLAQTPDSWTQKMSLPSDGRGAAAGFSIGKYGYVGTGLNFSAGGALEDFWQYDPDSDSWVQVANFGGGPRSGAVGISIGDKGYIITGADINASKQNDLWEYDPAANTWTQKADLPAPARNYSVGFTIGEKGYLATGYPEFTVDLDDCWEYDPAADTWTQKADFGGGARSSAVAFSIGDKGYMGTGYAGTYKKDFWSYNAATDTWTQKANVGNTPRSDGAAFALKGHGYICSGATPLGLSNDLLEYDTLTDTWTDRAPLPGTGRQDPATFVIDNHAYVATGYDNLFNQTTDLYQYAPDSSIGTFINAIPQSSQVIIAPHPLIDGGTITILSDGAVRNLELMSLEGKFISSELFSKQHSSEEKIVFRFNKSNLEAGIYYLLIREKERVTGSAKIVVQ